MLDLPTDLHQFLEQYYRHASLESEIDGTFTIQTPSTYCNLQTMEEDTILGIVSIRVEPVTLRGIGLGTCFVRKLISYTEQSALRLQALNVDDSAIRFWQQPELNFQKLSAYPKRWQRYPIPDRVALYDIARPGRQYG